MQRRAVSHSLRHAPRVRRDVHSFPTRRSSDLLDRAKTLPRAASAFSCGEPEKCAGCTGQARMRHDCERRCLRARKRNRSEEHTSELQSRGHLVCRHLLEKKIITYMTFAE